MTYTGIMVDQDIISAIAAKNQDYRELIIKASALGRQEEAGDLCDEQGQFLCDASRGLLVRARRITKLAEKNPSREEELLGLSASLRQYSQVLAENYRLLESLQREGLMPTNLPDLSSLLE